MRLSALTLVFALPALSACVEGAGPGLSGGPVATRSIAEQCVIRAARAVGKKTTELPVLQSLSYPEGDIVVVDVPGMGKIRCNADITGTLGDLIWIEGGPAKPAAAPAVKAS